jgi:hypothetical protein
MAKGVKMARVKKKEHENLSDSNIKKVIELLEAKQPITKKHACEILNISYNTTRLNNIIEGYKHKKEIEAKNRKAKRGKPATKDEISDIIREYLNGTSISEISKDIFRSSSFVSNIIDRVGVPRKLTKEEMKENHLLPDQCMAYEFKYGQIAWSAKYNAPCEVREELQNTDTVNYEEKYGCKCYKIYVVSRVEEPVPGFSAVEIGGYNAISPASELGDLTHLIEFCPSVGKI